MGKPRMIILIRHAQSEGNKNRDMHQSVPDHRIKLTELGKQQALEAGRKLRTMLRPDDKLHFFTSPYRRTRETTEGILESLTSDNPAPSPFQRRTIKVYEEPRLREQDFGNFQPCSAEMERMWQERADYGHFFYRIQNGESAADAYDRISGFNESLWRLFNEDDFASVCVLVTHGLMSRIFLMKWYHWSVEYFEDLRNVNHCEFIVMKRDDSGKYMLQNHLRTWSDLQRQKQLERLEREKVANKDGVITSSSSTTAVFEQRIPFRRKWGGCPDGCNHGLTKHWKKRPQRQSTREEDTTVDGECIPTDQQQSNNLAVSSTNKAEEPPDAAPGTTEVSHGSPTTTATHRHGRKTSEILSHGLAFLHLGGRDGGGSRSGATSRISSDSEPDGASLSYNNKKSAITTAPPRYISAQRHWSEGLGVANSLGDRDDGYNSAVGSGLSRRSSAGTADADDEAGGEGQDQVEQAESSDDEVATLQKEKQRDQSVMGSVY
ncbi:hypothetical protein AJ80_02576 [Polytolypa hystricis UAMH7299]|uniref:Phosphoglycerate mutase n=1 Tax=Polytolypa hystricis (strain UAMH7299) TaxID=1447883 RepID=A0A2B7YGW2_POLH7|nr:hypothetical protein AJ80_02576 [Polytolypa hystricis UAMH7299]